MSEGQEYPESWDEHAQASAEMDKEIKLKAGDTVRMHIISGPLTFRENYFETGEKTEQGKPKKKRIALPFASQLPGYQLKVKYLIEVVILDGPAKGQHKLFSFGKQVADGLEQIKKVWGSVRIPDVVVNRQGSGQNDTKYTATAAPSTLDPKSVPCEFDLLKEVRFSTKEDIDKLPPPPTVRPQDADSTTTTLSPKQLSMIGDLAETKSIGEAELAKMIERKVGSSKPVEKLTVGEASSIIDLLKNY